MVDHGAGKSYLGFILYDLYSKERANGGIIGIETRPELVEKSRQLASRLGFSRMRFLACSVEDSLTDPVRRAPGTLPRGRGSVAAPT